MILAQLLNFCESFLLYKMPTISTNLEGDDET